MTGALRLALRVAAMAAALLVALPLHALWRAARSPSPWPRRLLAAVAGSAGARPTVRGTPAPHAFIVANHVSWLDIPTLAGATGTAFVAKGELAGVPLIGWLCRLNRTVFVDRGRRDAIGDQVAAIRQGLGDGGTLAIFPEGTTGNGRELLPFKAALLSALDPPPPGVTVQPVWIDYGRHAPEIAWVGDEPALTNVRRILSRPGRLPVTLHLLAPFDPAAIGDRKAIAAEARARIVAAMAA